MRKNLLKWQYSGYSLNHQNKTNLIIHVLSVPVFWFGFVLLLLSLLFKDIYYLIGGFICLFIPLVLQGVGHKKEINKPEPFLSAGDFIMRFVVEQLITFPRYFLKLVFSKNNSF